jgi:hypothetical protein
MIARIVLVGEVIAWLFLAVALYFVGAWALERGNDLRHEYLLGAGMAWSYGAPFWLGVPALAAWKRRDLSGAQRLRAAVLFGVALLIVAITLFGGGRPGGG